MSILIEQANEQGQVVHLETEQTLNRRGRVIEATLRVVRDGKAIWEGPDTRDSTPTWRAAIAEAARGDQEKKKKAATTA